MGGKFHLKLNNGERPIANKYREGKMQRTLKRELKVLEIVKREAIGASNCLRSNQPLGVSSAWIVRGAIAPPCGLGLAASGWRTSAVRRVSVSGGIGGEGGRSRYPGLLNRVGGYTSGSMIPFPFH
jgi:hypothetical protein